MIYLSKADIKLNKYNRKSFPEIFSAIFFFLGAIHVILTKFRWYLFIITFLLFVLLYKLFLIELDRRENRIFRGIEIRLDTLSKSQKQEKKR